MKTEIVIYQQEKISPNHIFGNNKFITTKSMVLILDKDIFIYPMPLHTKLEFGIFRI